MENELACTYEEFKQRAGEFLKNIAPTEKEWEALDRARACVSHSFLNVQYDESNPLHVHLRTTQAPIIMGMVTRAFIQAEIRINSLATTKGAA